MDIVYAQEPVPETFSQSIFLAGPTPRSPEVASWRPEALHLLSEAGYKGVVFVPEPASGVWHGDYDDQIEWEQTCLGMSDAILFWVPRQLGTLPGFTTNTEFGQWLASGRISVFGAPPTATKVGYQQWLAERHGIPLTSTLQESVEKTLESLEEAAERHGGERNVPLFVWHSESFQAWYQSQLAVGNRLDHASVHWQFKVGPKRVLFFWTLHVKIYIGSEQRWKTNEVVIGRPDIACIVLIHLQPDLLDSEVILVREFRSPVRNALGAVLEVPSGSTNSPAMDQKKQALNELQEETGFILAPHRLKQLGSRQLCATLASHHAHVYAAKITDEELQWFEDHAQEVHGVSDDSERTRIEIKTFQTLPRDVDWSMLGMLLYGLQRFSLHA